MSKKINHLFKSIEEIASEIMSLKDNLKPATE